MLRSQVYRWLLFAATELEQPLWRIARHTALYPQELRLPAEPSLARQDFAEMAAVLERHMKDRRFVVGNEVTVAGCLIVRASVGPDNGGDSRVRIDPWASRDVDDQAR
jgi:glutathione S-transferase